MLAVYLKRPGCTWDLAPLAGGAMALAQDGASRVEVVALQIE